MLSGTLHCALQNCAWRVLACTNRDTFDKIVFDDLKNNATLTAMLVYLASEDPELLPRDQRVLPTHIFDFVETFPPFPP